MAVTLRADPVENGVAVLHLSGRADAAAAEEMDKAILPLAGDAEVRRLIIELGGLQYISSMGLRVVLSALKLLHARGGAMCIAGASVEVRGVLKSTGLLSLMKSFDSLSDALNG